MSATFGCVALLVQIVANLKVPFLRHKRDDDLPPLMAPPSEWLQQLKLDGVKHDDARNSYLSLLRGVLSGMFFRCDPTTMSASEYEDCVHVLTDGHAFGRGLSLHAVTMAGHRRMRRCRSSCSCRAAQSEWQLRGDGRMARRNEHFRHGRAATVRTRPPSCLSM